MTDTNPASAAEASGATVTPPSNGNLESEFGITVIDDNVVGKIAGLAAREVSGVYNLGGGAARVWGAVRETLTSSTAVQQGIGVAVDTGHASVAVAIIAEYGVAIHELARAIQENVTQAVTRMTGLIVDRVDVTVHDVHLPGQDTNGRDGTSEQAAPSAPAANAPTQ
ncbi:Alkaline shock protein 23 [Corynebacterium capitovis DSM 44611]|uniref:Asp23/Gls24 family envelope stress response protein n=1 Tax=Corynebacterium capitovis TaxID=131081 RepID=UPI00036B4F9E|nr:Asp23/Gls24 family envelope stress response protein [Corynebacterium capitovis]WKD56845.1 Alkaline shock protein 23 [Corynebacterium capitovis DSM 44611]